MSPNAAIDLSSAPGNGSGEFSVPADMMFADLVPAGIGVSQTMTGNVASGWARTFIGCCAPSMVIAGQPVVLATTARATAPCGPSTT